MPQMAPMNWLILFIIFTLTFLIFNTINYFSFKYQMKPSSISKKSSKINWKW
uniref:ATP synthase F0 subunit 8 n=1 Tax=Philonthus spinipes TaxID=878362 RepID=UPI001FA74965|nr:ATP synthase F0 subunit 8 [Philonthus spinipes]ULT46827.1 ATP synthase F0 subunit 8 [Philonthus spinipes]